MQVTSVTMQVTSVMCAVPLDDAVFLYLLLQEREVKFFTETEENNQMRGPRTGVPYFL